MARNWHFWSFWARPCRLIQCPVGGSVGGCGARAVSRKTPIYFIIWKIYSLLKTSLSIFLNHDDEDTHVDSDDGNSGSGDVDDSDDYACIIGLGEKSKIKIKTCAHGFQ